MNPRHLEFVVAVADHESFTRAAEALSVSQPALSHAITALEEQLGAPLFQRLGRAVSLTSTGEAFVESARPVLRQLSVLKASLNAVTELKAGHLDVATPHAAAADLVARLVGEFRRRYPGLRVRIQTSENPREIERYVRTGRSELALTMEEVEPPLLSETIGTEDMFAVFPPGTKLKRRPVNPADLAGQPLIVPSGSYQYYSRLREREHPGEPPPEDEPFIAVETESRQALIPLVLAGAGFSFLPRALAEGAKRQGLVIAPMDPAIRREIRLVTRPGPLSPAARAFLELARANATEVNSGETKHQTGSRRSQRRKRKPARSR